MRGGRQRENAQIGIGNHRAPTYERLTIGGKHRLQLYVTITLQNGPALSPVSRATNNMSTAKGKKQQTQLKNPRGIPQAPFIVSEIDCSLMRERHS